ncbi:MAG: RHS repeat-associated core domain-containing protein [Bacteroidales bacterium]|nr:RHS repeat-associated core domain-containing protein [Bacteroidales bacterium]
MKTLYLSTTLFMLFLSLLFSALPVSAQEAGGTVQTYAYAYDTYGSLTSGTHSGGNGETAAYDKNGNLTSMARTGARAETLSYTYTSGTNRLGKVTVGGSQKSYAYNADGTMKTDGLRGLSVTYNALKLPRQMKASSNTGTVDYIYDALGNKLAVKQGGTVKNYYSGEFVYNASLAVDYILTPNGQMTRNPSTGNYTAQYNLTDHLGNVRSVVNGSGTVLQSTLAFSDSNISSNRYLYNGKELEDYTVGSSYLGTLDYGARHYDPRIGRWTVPDPMAEKYYGINGYGYCAGNPIRLIDPDGQNWYSYYDENGERKYTYYQGQLTAEEIKEKGYTDMGFSFVDQITKSYYSLFGNILPAPNSNDSFIEYKLYQQLDELLIKDYSQKHGARVSFYFKIPKGSYKFQYGRADFKGYGLFEALNNETNSILHIGQMPSPKTFGKRTGYYKSSELGYQLVLYNDTKRPYDPIQIVFREEDYAKFNSALNNLFKNYIQVIYDNSFIKQ